MNMRLKYLSLFHFWKGVNMISLETTLCKFLLEKYLKKKGIKAQINELDLNITDSDYEVMNFDIHVSGEVDKVELKNFFNK